jgi:hypothetical protein
MKTLLALAFAVTLVACTEQQSTTGYVASQAAPQAAPVPLRGPAYYSPPNSPYRNWTTAQLQERRRVLYAQTTYTQTGRGQPVFIHHGENSHEQDEIYAIEAELNRRYQAGDNSAELKRAIPGEQHPH